MDATQRPDWTNIMAVAMETGDYETSTLYDALNRLQQLTTPDTGKTKYTYDRGGLLYSVAVEGVHSLDSNIVNKVEYDAKGQRQKVQYQNGATTTYEYDAFTFRVKNIKTIRASDGKVLQDLQYWYDPIGNITLQKDGALQPVYFDGTVAQPDNDYTYDALYRLIQAEGREHAGNNNAPGYNDSSRTGITPIPVASTDTAKMRRYIQYYDYDAVGNFIQMQHTVTGGTGNWTRYYTTDSNSNRLQSSVIGSGTPESYAYDNRGNIVSGFSHLQSMSYNAENRLEKIIITGTRTAYYQYDANGQRVRKTITDTGSNTTEIRKYVGEWEVYSKLAGSSLNIERETLHISDDTGRIALIDTRTQGTGAEPSQLLRYQYSNHLQSASLELDDTAAIISYEEYYPYGSTSFQSGRSLAEVSLKRYRYTGKERDEESGLYYHGARYYIPWLCRWAAADPVNSDWYNLQSGNGIQNTRRNLLSLTASAYEYCYDNPVRFTDPTGEQAVPDSMMQGEPIQDVVVTAQAKKPSFWQKARAFAVGFAKGVVIAAAVTLTLAAIAATGGTAAIVVGIVAEALVGVAAVGVATTAASVITGKDVFTGRKLGTLERFETGGELVGGLLGGIKGTKLATVDPGVAPKMELPVVPKPKVPEAPTFSAPTTTESPTLSKPTLTQTPTHTAKVAPSEPALSAPPSTSKVVEINGETGELTMSKSIPTEEANAIVAGESSVLSKMPGYAKKESVGLLQWLKNTFEGGTTLTTEQANEIINEASKRGLTIGSPEYSKRYGFHVNIQKASGARPNVHLPIQEGYKLPSGVTDTRPSR